MPLVYAFVARRDGIVLCDHSAVAGNWEQVGTECLAGEINEERFTVTADGYTFNYLVQGQYGAR